MSASDTSAVERVCALVERAHPKQARVRRLLDVVQGAPEPVRPRLLDALGEVEPALRALIPETDGPLCPAYPDAPQSIQARIALGEPPVRILRGLTRREAHEALRSGCADPAAWIVLDVPCESIRSVAVARWVAACWADPPRRAALQTEREERGPGGAVIRGRLIDRIDEIQPADLDAGPATGVQRAYQRAGRRLYAAWESRAQDDGDQLAPPPRWWRPIRCAQLLLSTRALIREGREMGHCAGVYSAAVAERRSVVVSIAVRDGRGQLHRSTVELEHGAPGVIQHKGTRNGAPPALCERALDVCLRRWGSSLP